MRFFLSRAVVGAMPALLPAAAAAQNVPGPYPYGPGMMWGWGWSGLFLGPLFMIVPLAIIIAVIVLLVRWLGGPWQGPAHHGPPAAPPGRSALDILNERFARGEIDQAEYEAKRRLIS